MGLIVILKLEIFTFNFFHLKRMEVFLKNKFIS